MTKTNAGRFFEDYSIGQVIDHAVPRTVSDGERALYHALYPARHALYSSDEFARGVVLRNLLLMIWWYFMWCLAKLFPMFPSMLLQTLGMQKDVGFCRFMKAIHCDRVQP